MPRSFTMTEYADALAAVREAERHVADAIRLSSPDQALRLRELADALRIRMAARYGGRFDYDCVPRVHITQTQPTQPARSISASQYTASSTASTLFFADAVAFSEMSAPSRRRTEQVPTPSRQYSANLSQEGSIVPTLAEHSRILRDTERSLYDMDRSVITSQISKLLRMNFSTLSVATEERLSRKRTALINMLRSAYVELCELENHNSRYLERLSQRRYDLFVYSPENVVRNSVTVTAHDYLSWLKEVSSQGFLSPQYIRTLLWKLFERSAYHGVTFDNLTTQYSVKSLKVRTNRGSEGEPTYEIIEFPRYVLSESRVPDERAKAFAAAVPRYFYHQVVRTVSQEAWPMSNNAPYACGICSNARNMVMSPDITVSRDAYGYVTQRVCSSCAASRPRCQACNMLPGSRSYRVVEPTNPDAEVIRLSDLTVPIGVLCQACSSRVVDDYTAYNTPNGHIFVRSSYVRRIVVATVQSYSHQPTYMISSAQNEVVKPDTLLFGLELECGWRNSNRDEQYYLDKIAAPDIYFKHDGSVSSGIEVVSHPFTFRHWKDTGFHVWSKRLELMKAEGIRSYNHPNCGIHIHMSRNSFTVAQLKRLQDLVYGNPDLFQRLSQRDIFEYCKVVDPDRATEKHRLGRALQFAPSTSVSRRRLSASLVNAAVVSRNRNYDRRTAVNFPDNKPTVEIRIFRGTLHAPSFAKNVELCHAMHSFTAQLSVTADVPSSKEFIDFVYANDKVYHHLAAFIDKWYRRFRPVARVVPPQYAVVRPPVKFENTDQAVASAS